jgi:ABC-2 type transport system ATP-binding protein
MPNIKATDLGLTLKRQQIFSGLHFKIQQGEGLVITGPNGSGKTLLLRLLAGKLKPSSGKLFKDRHFSNQQYCDFDSKIDEYLSVSQFYSCWGNSTTQDETIDQWNLSSIWKRRLDRISLGEKKRAKLATALSHNPSFLLLDEPDLGLDQGHASLMADIFSAIPSSCTTILTSHHQEIYDSLGWEKLSLRGES